VSTLPKLNLRAGVQSAAPVQHFSEAVKFINDVAKREPNKTSTSVDVFSTGDNEWYCQVCRGKQKTLPMGPYTKLQAERVQDLRRRMIAREGTARLVFEPDRRWLAMTPRGNDQSTARKNKPAIRRALAAIRSLVMPLLSR
jgi:hypothetical protein